MTSGLLTTNIVTTGDWRSGYYPVTTSLVTTGGPVTTGDWRNPVTTNLVTTGGPMSTGRPLTSGDITTNVMTSGPITTNQVTTLRYATTSGTGVLVFYATVESCGITVESCVEACGSGKVVKCLCENGDPVILCDTTTSNSGKLIVSVSLLVLSLFA